jgi:hypothetical protein
MKKKFVFKCWFDKETQKPLGINTWEICSNCPHRPKDADSNKSLPPNMSGLYVVDLDQKLGELTNRKSNIVPAEMQVIIETIEDSAG